MTVYLITEHETEGYIGFGSAFTPEIFTEKERAERRHASLQGARREHSGLFYTIEAIELDTENAVD